MTELVAALLARSAIEGLLATPILRSEGDVAVAFNKLVRLDEKSKRATVMIKMRRPCLQGEFFRSVLELFIIFSLAIVESRGSINSAPIDPQFLQGHNS